MKRMLFVVWAGLVAFGAGAADWNGAYIGGKTAEGKCFYAAGETMTFRLQVGGIAALPAGDWQIKWTRTGDDGVTQSGTAPVSLSEPCEVTTSLDRPGFVRIQASVVGAPAAVRFDGGAGVDFANIVADQGEPADFEGFWRSQLAALGRVAADPQLTELASPKAGVRLYTFRLGCVGGKPATGYLSVPAAEGTYPARLLFYGYNQSWTADVLKAPKAGDLATGEIQLRVNAHGLELDREDAYYAAAKAAVSWGTNFHGWNPAENEEPETSYYLNMILRDVRAAQYAQTLAKWNGRDLVVDGGSQGAFQSVLVASLCPQVSAAQVHINWMCDLRGKEFGGRLASEFQPPYRPGLDYFDEVFHARRINSSCYVNVTRAGLGDYISPPTGIACLYNALRCRKRIVFVQNAEHSWTTSAPGNPSFVFQAEKPAAPGPEVDWRDLRVGSCTVADGTNFTNEQVTVTIADVGAYGQSGERLRLTVRNAAGVVVATVEKPLVGAGVYAFDTAEAEESGIVPGGAYSYDVSPVSAAGVPLVRKGVCEGVFKTGRTKAAFYAHAATDETMGGDWREKPSVVDGAYRITRDSAGIEFGLSDPRSGVVRVLSRVRIEGGLTAKDLSALAAQLAAERVRAALVLVDGPVSYWALPVRVGGSYDFLRLFGMENPEEGETYEILVETDTSTTPPVVGYRVGPVGGERTLLADADGRTAFPLDGEAAPITAVKYGGRLSLETLDGEREDAAPYAVDGANLELNTNVRLDPAELAPGAYSLVDGGFRFRWDDTTRYMVHDAATGTFVVSDQAPANGVSGFENYVLGLDAADATSAPALDLALSPAAVELTLRQRNGAALVPRTVPGAGVVYRFERADNVGFVGAQTTEERQPELSIPRKGEAGFYRARIVVREDERQ